MHSDWLSNAYLVADEPGGTAVFIDSGAPLAPLLAEVEEHGVRPTHLLVTHAHADHVAGDDELMRRYDLERLAFPLGDPIVTGSLRIRPLRHRATPTTASPSRQRPRSADAQAPREDVDAQQRLVG